MESVNGSHNRENDHRVLGLTRAGLFRGRVLLLRVILTGEVLLRVLGLSDGAPAGVLVGVVLAS